MDFFNYFFDLLWVVFVIKYFIGGIINIFDHLR